MNRKEETRNYKMSDADLIQLSDSVQDSAHTGPHQARRLRREYRHPYWAGGSKRRIHDSPTDHFLSGKMMLATEKKNAKREELLLALRQIVDRARIKYGENSANFKAFGVKMLTKQTDNELYRMGRGALLAAIDLQPDLASEGLTPAKVTELETLISQFNTLLDEKERAVRNRDAAVDTRIKLGNELYALLVNLAAKGKLCWADTNESLYNDYILNPSKNTTPTITGNVDSNSVVNLSVTGVKDSTMFTLKNTGEGELQFYFAPDPTDAAGAQAIAVAPHKEILTTATALGRNTLNNRLNVHNTSGNTGSYAVKWE